MPVVTVQLGQCGNQLGCAFFQALGQEFASVDYGRQAVEEWFRPLQGGGQGVHTRGDTDRYVARAVMIDMEPKVVNACRAAAASGSTWWRYPPRGFLTMSSGSGNNWAHGFHGYGPTVHEDTLDLVRREVEACDLLGGFSLVQSMAGGTGAGLGTYVAQALRDEYQSSHIVNCCVWPYESGEVIVQSYNTLLTLTHLHELSDGIVLMSNEALHRTAHKIYNIPRPSFGDMNAIAARAMANLLLPSTSRPASGSSPAGGGGHADARAGTPGGRASPSTSAGPGAGSASRPGSAHSAGAPPSPATPVGGGATRGGWPGLEGGGGTPHRLLSDMVSQLCCHPHYRLLSLRSIPQVPAASTEFTTFSWGAMLKRLRQMHITGSVQEEGMDWGVTTADSSPQGGGGHRQWRHPGMNRALASWLVLRGQASGEVDASEFGDPGMYPEWTLDPLKVTYASQRFNNYLMAAASLSNDQAPLGPITRMQEAAYAMLASRAFVHQYEAYGLGVADFQGCFAHVEEIAARYASL
ncbi:hypothetical protein FOA52_001827 [Chlamydomonas sp. UWO 241]|nr:hypothetical protein FOA52_001827 [Chlamydomonas sp. UWO 241]